MILGTVLPLRCRFPQPQYSLSADRGEAMNPAKVKSRRKLFPQYPKTPYSEHLRKNKMTITAAFYYSDGVVLCADSQYTVPVYLGYVWLCSIRHALVG